MGSPGSRQYFEAEPAVVSDERTVTLLLPDMQLTLRTDRGVFAHGQVDAGTKHLLLAAPPPPAEAAALADVGCGYGAIAVPLARRAPNATVWAVDVNARALRLCAANAAANGVDNIRASAPDALPVDLELDALYSNPPIRIGKAALHALLTEWLARLRPDGHAYLVVQKHLGADSLARWLVDVGNRVERLASRGGYRILDVMPTR